jgi:hypothetical protein
MKLLNRRFIFIAIAVLVSGSLLLTGCTNLNPTNPPAPHSYTPPAGQPTQPQDITVTYNYDDTSPVQLSANNLTMSVGQKLILQPAPGLTKDTRFTSSGDNFWGDIMKQEGDTSSGKAVFTAIKAGKGRLQIIPNATDTDRAVDLWVTVQ